MRNKKLFIILGSVAVLIGAAASVTVPVRKSKKSYKFSGNQSENSFCGNDGNASKRDASL